MTICSLDKVSDSGFAVKALKQKLLVRESEQAY